MYVADNKSKSIRIIFEAKAEDLHGYSDTSFTDAKGALITSGYIIKLVGDPMAWKIHRQGFLLLATCQVELSR